MNDERFFIAYMKNEKKTENIVLKFPQLFQEINELIKKIKLSDNVKMASINFDFLEEIQLMMTKLIVIEKIKLPAALLKFFKDFERVDDPEERNRLFDAIKNDNYKLDFEQFFAEEIYSLFHKIKLCKNLQEATKYLNCLDEIQLTIAKMICVDKTKVSDVLWKFFSDFDHIGEIGENERFFHKIKNEGYSL